MIYSLYVTSHSEQLSLINSEAWKISKNQGGAVCVLWPRGDGGYIHLELNGLRMGDEHPACSVLLCVILHCMLLIQSMTSFKLLLLLLVMCCGIFYHKQLQL